MKLLATIAMAIVLKLARVVRQIVRTTFVGVGMALTLVILDALLLRDENPGGDRSSHP